MTRNTPAIDEMCDSCRYWSSDFVDGLVYCDEAPDERQVPGDAGTCLDKRSILLKTLGERVAAFNRMKAAMERIPDLTEAEVLEAFRSMVVEKIHDT